MLPAGSPSSGCFAWLSPSAVNEPTRESRFPVAWSTLSAPLPEGPTMPAKTATKRPAKKAPPARMTLAEAMRELEKAGSEQTRKTYARHGARGPMFGVSFATLKTLVKRIGVDHDLALALWDTGNFDARNLALKIADPARISSADLDRWASTPHVRMCAG